MEMSGRGGRRLGRRGEGEREKESFARQVATPRQRNRAEMCRTRGLSRFGPTVMRQSRLDQLPVILASSLAATPFDQPFNLSCGGRAQTRRLQRTCSFVQKMRPVTLRQPH